MTTATTFTALERLQAQIELYGPVKTARVSSAQARGAASRYSYWGVARYELRISSDGKRLVNVALERASSDRRSMRLAQQDLAELCKDESRVHCPKIGTLSEHDAEQVLAGLHDLRNPAACK